MPLRMGELLWARRRYEQRQSMAEVEKARQIRDEAFARSKLSPAAPLEGKAAPIDPPTRGRAA